MNLSITLPWQRAPAPRRKARAQAPEWVNASSLAAAPPAPPDEVAGCGWFDSSHALHSGLSVTEHATPERVANEVPLGWWLDWQSTAGARSVRG